jgi:kynureninase
MTDSIDDRATALDANAPLSDLRDRFHLPDALYMDGNSLGPLSDAAATSLSRAISEWRDLGIGGWTDGDPPWFEYGERLGDLTAPLIGASEHEVVVANSTTANVHALFATFYDPERPTVLVNALDFPTDHYAIRSVMRLGGVDPDEHLVLVESHDGRTIEEADIEAAIEAHDDLGIVFMPSVLYRSGQLLDVERITRAAHEAGALCGFDLAHSIGVVPHRLSEYGVDFAVWCSYKYLNGGPGAIAGLYANDRHLPASPGLSGWWGHEKETQFDMNLTYTPAPDVGAFQVGTVPVLSAAPLFGALSIVTEAGIEAIRERSRSLTGFLIELVDEIEGFAVGTPRDPERRGGHVAVEHGEAHRISQALRERGVIVDYRPPNVIRVCPAPLYTTHADVARVANELREITETREYERFDAASDGVT